MDASPNIVFILVDDLGYMDVGYQNPHVKTPRIDRLAAEGRVFTAAYAATVCSPARASIMTGRTPASLKLTSHIPGVGFEAYYRKKFDSTFPMIDAAIVDHLPRDEVTLAEAFKRTGYTTGFFGKWHLAGEGSQRTNDGIVNPAWHPQHQGFDVNVGGCAYGQPAGPTPYFAPYANGELRDGPRGEHLTDRLTDEAVQFITTNRDRPFFVYLSFYAIHSPLNPDPQMLQRAHGNRYVAMINHVDRAVGRVLDSIDKLGLRDNTIVILTSDNGGTRSQKPLRGVKGTPYEGGIRVPLLYRWPGRVQAGSTSTAPVGCEDFYPTLLEAASIETPKDAKPIEGISYLSVLVGDAEGQSRPLYQHFPHHRYGKQFMGSSSIRDGDWKLILWHRNDSMELYNLADDPGESNNLAPSQPERAGVMKNQLLDWLEHTQANMPRPNPLFTATDMREK